MLQKTAKKNKKNLPNQLTKPKTTQKRQIRTRSSQITHSLFPQSLNTSNRPKKLQKTNKRSFLGSLFGAAKDQRVVYEPLNSFNPITLRSTVVPVAYKFPSYILPSIDIISVASRQSVTPNYADTCYIIDKTPKLLQLPSISAVTNDSKFVQVFAEATICVSNALRFSLIGDNYVQVLQSLVETSVANVISYVGEKDVLDKQYESFLVTNIHQDLQRLCDDVGVDVLKLVVMPSQLDLTNVAAQLQLLQTMNDLSLAIQSNNDNQNQGHYENPLLELAETGKDNHHNNNGELNFSQQQANDLLNLVSKMMKTNAQFHSDVIHNVVEESKNDPIEDGSGNDHVISDVKDIKNSNNNNDDEKK
jgi:hypothetical protein